MHTAVADHVDEPHQPTVEPGGDPREAVGRQALPPGGLRDRMAERGGVQRVQLGVGQLTSDAQLDVHGPILSCGNVGCER